MQIQSEAWNLAVPLFPPTKLLSSWGPQGRRTRLLHYLYLKCNSRGPQGKEPGFSINSPHIQSSRTIAEGPIQFIKFIMQIWVMRWIRILFLRMKSAFNNAFQQPDFSKTFIGRNFPFPLFLFCPLSAKKTQRRKSFPHLPICIFAYSLNSFHEKTAPACHHHYTCFHVCFLC